MLRSVKAGGQVIEYELVQTARASVEVRVLPDGYLIAGDYTTVLERDITDAQILGVMKRVIRDGKDNPADDPKYLLYVHLWCDFYPVRMIILRVKRRIIGILRGVKRWLPGA